MSLFWLQGEMLETEAWSPKHRLSRSDGQVECCCFCGEIELFAS